MTAEPATTTPAAPPLRQPVIRYKNGQEDGKVVFPELDIFRLQKFVKLLCDGETPELVMLCTGRNREWMLSITFETYLELARYFINSNFRRALDIAEHDPIMALKVGPLLMEMSRVLSSVPSTISAPTLSSGSDNGSALPSSPPSTEPLPETSAAAAG